MTSAPRRFTVWLGESDLDVEDLDDRIAELPEIDSRSQYARRLFRADLDGDLDPETDDEERSWPPEDKSDVE